MKALFIIVVYLLNAKTGEVEQQLVSQTPMTLEQCSQTLVERGPVAVREGLAVFAVCEKVKADVSL